MESEINDRSDIRAADIKRVGIARLVAASLLIVNNVENKYCNCDVACDWLCHGNDPSAFRDIIKQIMQEKPFSLK